MNEQSQHYFELLRDACRRASYLAEQCRDADEYGLTAAYDLSEHQLIRELHEIMVAIEVLKGTGYLKAREKGIVRRRLEERSEMMREYDAMRMLPGSGAGATREERTAATLTTTDPGTDSIDEAKASHQEEK